jgi:NADPH:quinone reductase-like Zn-dependent oxidoreductase
METFRALVVDKADDGVTLTLDAWSTDRLMDGDVTIQVEYSSINYKDGLAVRADGRVVRAYPLIPGIDLAGIVTESADSRHPVGSLVIVHGYDLGVAHHGGFAERARVPAA